MYGILLRVKSKLMEPKNLTEWLEYLEMTRPQSNIRLGLETIKCSGNSIGALKQNAFIYTVAGTNGKGSTIAILEAILIEAGYKVGSYTSPHIETFNERIKINGVPITDELICESFSKVSGSKESGNLSYFEFITMVALHCFSQQDLDVIILEVGMGGRLDAVNSIDPDVSIITSIGLDHQKFLGDTEEKIAYEKSGIMRHKKPLIYGGTSMYAAILDQSSLKQVPVYSNGNSFYIAQDQANSSCHWHGVNSRGKKLTITSILMPDNLVLNNIAVAIQALQFFNHEIPIATIKKGLTQVQILGRCQKIIINYNNKVVDVILDVAHNPQAVEYFIKQLTLTRKNNGKVNVVFSVFADKNYKRMLDLLKKITAKFFVASADHERSLSTDKLSEYLSLSSIDNSKHSSVSNALISAINHADNAQPVVIVGSFSLIEKALQFFKNECSCINTISSLTQETA